jgi:hypothetical protein
MPVRRHETGLAAALRIGPWSLADPDSFGKVPSVVRDPPEWGWPWCGPGSHNIRGRGHRRMTRASPLKIRFSGSEGILRPRWCTVASRAGRDRRARAATGFG